MKSSVDIMNKQSRAADKGWSSNLGLVVGLPTIHHKGNTVYLLGNVAQGLRLELILWIVWWYQSKENKYEIFCRIVRNRYRQDH
jgi:hypothetical protein